MVWKRPSETDLRQAVSRATESLLICSPFITRPGLRTVADSLQASVSRIEIWTRFSERDWLTGATDPDGLIEFVEDRQGSINFNLRISNLLHAKFIIADQASGLVGSSNLTYGGYARNIEIAKAAEGAEIGDLLGYINSTRPLLSKASVEDLREFVTRCNTRVADREALIDLVREVAPAPPPGRRPIIPLNEFIRYCQSFSGEAPDNIRIIYYNTDGNNRTGHLKQGFYGCQRFLQEFPQHIVYVASRPSAEPLDLRGTPLEHDWSKFLADFGGESDDVFGYDVSTLQSYLTPDFGGHRLGGGGGDYPFKLVWPLVARMMGA